MHLVEYFWCINEENVIVIILHARKKIMCPNKNFPQQNVGGIN
jgi:hypothetical protein